MTLIKGAASEKTNSLSCPLQLQVWRKSMKDCCATGMTNPLFLWIKSFFVCQQSLLYSKDTSIFFFFFKEKYFSMLVLKNCRQKVYDKPWEGKTIHQALLSSSKLVCKFDHWADSSRIQHECMALCCPYAPTHIVIPVLLLRQLLPLIRAQGWLSGKADL